jgi:hypothetical protein
MRPGDLNRTGKHGDDMNEKTESAKSKDDFIRLAGIGPELAEFLSDFIEKPENFFSISLERRRKIETQMDAILSVFVK